MDDDIVRKIQKGDGQEHHRQEERSKDHKTEHRGSGASASGENERYHGGLKDLTYRRNTDYHNLKAGGGRSYHDKKHADNVRHGDKGNPRESEKRYRRTHYHDQDRDHAHHCNRGRRNQVGEDRSLEPG